MNVIPERVPPSTRRWPHPAGRAADHRGRLHPIELREEMRRRGWVGRYWEPDGLPLRIAHLYPSLLNVAGDGGNVMAIVQRCAWRGIPTEVVEVEQGDTPDFTTFDLILFHGGQDVEMDVVARDLGLKVPSLQAADQGVLIFAVCAGLQLLGHRYIPSVGEPMEGAAILDLETRGGSQRFMQHAAVEVTINGQTGTVVGFENHSGQTTLARARSRSAPSWPGRGTIGRYGGRASATTCTPRTSTARSCPRTRGSPTS